MAKKWQAVRFSGPGALGLADLDVPPPRPGEVGVDVPAVGMNPADYKRIVGGQHPGLQAHLPDAHVVRALSHISSAEVTTAGRPAGTPHRRALAIAGDDQQAKHVVTAIYDTVGSDTLDLGGLDEARCVDPGQPVFLAHRTSRS